MTMQPILVCRQEWVQYPFMTTKIGILSSSVTVPLGSVHNDLLATALATIAKDGYPTAGIQPILGNVY